ncbi:hypothetical protein WA158_002195 [Blastocystis sp. Blastoise]
MQRRTIYFNSSLPADGAFNTSKPIISDYRGDYTDLYDKDKSDRIKYKGNKVDIIFKHNVAKYNGISLLIVCVVLGLVFLFGYTNGDSFIATRNMDSQVHFSEASAIAYLKKFAIDIGSRESGTQNLGHYTPDYIFQQLQLFKEAATTNEWKYKYEKQTVSGSYPTIYRNHPINSIYQNLTNIIVTLSNEQLDQSEASNILITVPIDTSISSPGAQESAISVASVLEIIRVLSQTSSSLYSNKLTVIFCSASKPAGQCIHGLLNSSQTPNFSLILSLDTDSGEGLSLFEENSKAFYLGKLFKQVSNPHGNTFISRFDSKLRKSSTSFSSIYLSSKYSSLGIPFVSLMIGVNHFISGTQLDVPKHIPAGYIQNIGDNLYTYICLLLKDINIKSLKSSSINSFFFMDLFGKYMITISYPSLTLFAVIYIIFFYLNQNKLQVGSINAGIIAYFPAIIAYFLGCLIVMCFMSLLHIPMFWYIHPIFSLIIYSFTGYLFIQTLSPRKLLWFETYFSSICLAICSFFYSSYSILFLLLTINPLITLFIMYLYERFYIQRSNQTVIQAPFYLYIAINMIPVVLFIAYLVHQCLSYLVPYAATLGNVSSFTSQIVILVPIAIFGLMLVISLHPFLPLFKSTTLVSVIFSLLILASILVSFFTSPYGPSVPRKLMLIHETTYADSMIEKNQRERYKVKENNIKIYAYDNNRFNKIRKSLNIADTSVSVLSDRSLAEDPLVWGLQGIQIKQDINNIVPSLIDEAPYIYIHRDQLCNKCKLKQGKKHVIWSRRSDIELKTVYNTITFVNFTSPNIVAWSLGEEVPQRMCSSSNHAICPYMMMFTGSPRSKVLRFTLYFSENIDMNINMIIHLSPQLLKDREIVENYELQYINSHLPISMATNMIYSIHKRILLPEIYDSRAFSQFESF